MAVRVEVEGELLRWARERARADLADLSRRFPRLPEWERGELAPTLKQLEEFAQSTHTPLGFLLLPEPPDEVLPLPDFRTMGDSTLMRPSADLLDTIFQCEQRQEWYREYSRRAREDRRSYVGSLTTETAVIEAAQTLRAALNFDVDDRGSSWSEAFRNLTENAEKVGVLVMVNGVVGNNTHRKLDPREFRGFAIADDFAPLVFVNGADTKAAQIFTLAHELVHIWLGQSALTDAEAGRPAGNDIERWCNQVAAEFLVPIQHVRDEGVELASLESELERLARRFKVSTLVVLRRVHDAGNLSEEEYWDAYRTELDRVLALMGEGVQSGGNFYNTQPIRVSKRFAHAVIGSALEGQTLIRDALQMLGVKKLSTFHELSHRLGFE